MAPVTGWDAVSAHIALPKDYAREGRIMLIPGAEYSAYPHLLHSLYSQVFYGGGERSVALLNWLLAACTCASAFALGFRTEGRRCGLVAAAVLATAPVFFDQAGSVSLDLAFCCLTLAALAALFTWHDERRRGWLLLAALLAGSSCGVRNTGYLTCVLLGFGVLLTAGERRWVALASFSGVAFAGAFPWLARSAALTGNPFYPFFAGVLGSDVLPHWNVTGLGTHVSIHGMGLKDLLLFPWNIVMRPQNYDGWSKSPGGLVLFLGIPGLIVGGRRARALGAFWLAGLICFFYFQRYARYMLPFFAAMMVVVGVAVCRLKRLRHVVSVALVVAFSFGLALDVVAVHFKIPVVLGLQSREEYLRSRIERYPAFEWINENIPPDETVLSFARRTYYIEGRTYENSEPLFRLRDQGLEAQLAWLRMNNVRWVFLPLTYIEESPGYREDLLDMVNVWRKRPRDFFLVKSFDLPRPRVDGLERVEIYKVRHD